MQLFSAGESYCINLLSQRELLAFIDTISSDNQNQIAFFSRLPHRRLIEHIDLEKIESYWISKQDVEGSLKPDLEVIFHKLLEMLANNKNIIIIEGLEWLISIHGFDEVFAFALKIKDIVIGTPASVLFSLALDVLSDLHNNKWNSEIKSWELPNQDEISQITVVENSLDVVEENIVEPEIQSTSLAFLTPITAEGYSQTVLRKRILQWKRMGLDVSELEPALFYSDDSKGFELYKSVEQKIRRAIELDNRLDLLLEQGWVSDVIKLRFRVRQLTGFDEVENRIDELI